MLICSEGLQFLHVILDGIWRGRGRGREGGKNREREMTQRVVNKTRLKLVTVE